MPIESPRPRSPPSTLEEYCRFAMNCCCRHLRCASPYLSVEPPPPPRMTTHLITRLLVGHQELHLRKNTGWGEASAPCCGTSEIGHGLDSPGQPEAKMFEYEMVAGGDEDQRAFARPRLHHRAGRI